MSSVTMFAGVTVKHAGSENQANIVPGPGSTGTSGTLGTLYEMILVYYLKQKNGE